jgi:hypothetical protein
MDIDVNDNRQMMINVFGLRGADEKFTFYYDETNNIRKFYLTDDGTNVEEHNNFVLGGIVLAPGQALPDIGHLRTQLRMQPTATEIKFTHIAKGDLEQVLTSDKLGIFLSWLLENEILIHYSSLNIIYWAIVDIIDSILAEKKFEAYRPYHESLKNELYRLVTRNKADFLAMMKRYGYPDIQRDKTAEFMSDVEAFLENHKSSEDSLPAHMLRNLIPKGANLPELAFLVDERENMLIDGFQAFYIRPISLFKNAVHIFDHEVEIETSLNRFKLRDGARQVDFSFSDSKAQPGIQIADVVTGLIGKYQSFVETHSLLELLRRKSTWSEKQTANFNLLRQLIDVSDAVSNAFIHRTTAMDSTWKNDAFMRDLQPMPHLL